MKTKNDLLTPSERWEQGIDHHPKSIELFNHISKEDITKNDDYFCWKHGGDGDNGETLMYLMDSYFEKQDILDKIFYSIHCVLTFNSKILSCTSKHTWKAVIWVFLSGPIIWFLLLICGLIALGEWVFNPVGCWLKNWFAK